VLSYAAFLQGLDFLFLAVYSTTLSLGCLWARRVIVERGWPLAFLGVPLAWGQWLAAACDAIENVALAALLFGGPASPWPQAAWACAAVKFALIFLGLVYVFYGLAVRLAAPAGLSAAGKRAG
jgi:hypothetical protein